jgi:UDP-N-acetylmuramoylalanine--D-glutamate ligase
MAQAHDPLVPHGVWQGLQIGVLGFGRSGRAAARLLAAQGCRVVVFEDRPRERATAEELAEAAGYMAARFGDLADCRQEIGLLQALVLSPGVPMTHPLLHLARERGLPLLGELELAARRVRNPIVGVTGTNGKSTTATLLQHALDACRRRVTLAGNIGTPLSDVVNGLRPDDVVVLELSSYQLETIETLHPQVAVLTNIAPDHLNRYASVDLYAAAKRRMLMNMGAQDVFVFGFGDAWGESWARQSEVTPLCFAAESGEAMAKSSLDGAFVHDGALWRRWRGTTDRVVALEELQLLGLHNQENLCATIAALLPFGLEAEPLGRALSSFKGLPHRSELVIERRGVRFVNDSKATNVHAAATCLRGMPGPIVALFGGSSKGEDFAPLRDVVANVKLAICYGAEGDRIAAALSGRLPIERVENLKSGLRVAVQKAQRGDTILLSPACASFDEFRNFEDRGESFVRWVLEHVESWR